MTIESKLSQTELYAKQFFDFNTYIDINRWCSYYYQIKECQSMGGKSCLVIGKGDNIVPLVLESLGIKVYTFDFSEDLQPDFCGDVVDIKEVLPKDFTVDIILCCQVLEHLEYRYFEPILEQFTLIATKKVIISLPNSYIKIKIDVKISRIPQVKILFMIPRFLCKMRKNKEHYWEIGAKYYSLKKILSSIKKHFDIVKTYNVFQNEYHRFFILKIK